MSPVLRTLLLLLQKMSLEEGGKNRTLLRTQFLRLIYLGVIPLSATSWRTHDYV